MMAMEMMISTDRTEAAVLRYPNGLLVIRTVRYCMIK